MHSEYSQFVTGLELVASVNCSDLQNPQNIDFSAYELTSVEGFAGGSGCLTEYRSLHEPAQNFQRPFV
jgi:hypothetical protein